MCYGSSYISRDLAAWLDSQRMRHVRGAPHHPMTQGKAERFIQTLLREWAYAIPYRSSQSRSADLPRWLDWYNRRRPHSALRRLAPIAALNNAMRTHS